MLSIQKRIFFRRFFSAKKFSKIILEIQKITLGKEKEIETDRRIAEKKISQLKLKLKDIDKQNKMVNILVITLLFSVLKGKVKLYYLKKRYFIIIY